MNERIKEIRKSLGLSQKDFGDQIGVKQGSVAAYESGARVPLDAIITSICRTFSVNERWLRTGEGNMMIPKELDKQLDEILEQIASSEDELIKKIIKAYWALDDKEKAAIRKLIDGLCEK